MKKAKIGDDIVSGARVCVTWCDIAAELHSEDDIVPVIGETCGWVHQVSNNWVRIHTTRYMGNFTKAADKIVIPLGCIEKIEVV